MKIFYRILMVLIIYGLLAIPDNKKVVHTPTKNTVKSSERWWGMYAQNLVKFRIANAAYRAYHFSEHKKLLTHHLSNLAFDLVDANDPILDSITYHINKLSALVSLNSKRTAYFTELITQWRQLLRYQSRYWDVTDTDVAKALFNLYNQTNLALESAMIQAEIPNFYLSTGRPKEPFQTTLLDSIYFKSGDIILFNTQQLDSPIIPSFSTLPNSYKHLAVVHITNKNAQVSYLDIRQGLVHVPLQEFKNNVAYQGSVYRLRSDLPLMLSKPTIMQEFAAQVYDMAEKHTYYYDFRRDLKTNDALFDWEILQKLLGSYGIKWKSINFINENEDYSIGVEPHRFVFELECDHRFNFIGEWCQSPSLYASRINTAALTAVLDTAPEQKLMNLWVLPIYRIKKGYSILASLVGVTPPIPKGISAQTQMVLDNLTSYKNKLQLALQVALQTYESKQNHKATYLKMLQKSKELSKALASN